MKADTKHISGHMSLFEQVVMDTLGSVIVESKRSKAADKRSREVIRQHFNNAGWLDTVFNHQDNPEGLTYLDYMFKQFKETFYHDNRMSDRPIMRLEPLIAKIAFELNFQNTNPDAQKLERLRRMVNLMDQLSQQGKYDLSVIPLDASFDDLNKEFGEMIDNANKAESDEIANTEYTPNNDYTILGPLTYGEAHEYGNKSCPGSLLCYTQSEDTWYQGQYANNGLNNCYVALKNGWENIPAEHTDGNSAYDDYGLSMIFVFVDPEGNIATCNTRWNHKADYAPGFSCDNAMGKKELSELLGVRFDSVFKPKSKEELKEMGYILASEAQEMLYKGVDPTEIFSYVGAFKEGFAQVQLNNKWNFINQERKIISQKWFDYTYNFSEGFAVINDAGGWNYIDKDGKLLSPQQWFDDVKDFHEGFAAVKLNGWWNYINGKGEYLFEEDEGFYEASDFSEGFASVKLANDSWNFINKEGDLLWRGQGCLDDAGYFHEGFAWIEVYERYNYINKEGKLISQQWFDNNWDFNEGFAVVKLNGKCNYINTEGKYLSQQWFNDAWNFKEGFAQVQLNNKGWNYINQEGKLLSQQWFDMAWNFQEGFAAVYLNEKGWNFINKEGKIISQQWFDSILAPFSNGFGHIRLNGEACTIDSNGRLAPDAEYKTRVPVRRRPMNESLSSIFDLMNRMENL